MQKLTENVINQKIRPCPTDLGKITQLNVTGRGLSDISLIKKLVGLEVISLSVNKISSLSYFENCRNLRVLYLRQNKVQDLMEIKYLMHLPKLEVLSLSQNPCADEPFYRWTVIKHLKRLVELDGIPIAEEDRKEAELLGKNLPTHQSSSQIISNGPRIRRSHSKLNQAQKMTSATVVPETRIQFEKFRKKGSMEDTLIGVEHPSKLRINASRFLKSSYDDIASGLFSVESLSKLSSSQCRLFNGSKIDLRSTSSQALPVVENPDRPSNLLMAALFMVKDLCYSDLQILRAEVTAMLHAMPSNHQYEQKISND